MLKIPCPPRELAGEVELCLEGLESRGLRLVFVLYAHSGGLEFDLESFGLLQILGSQVRSLQGIGTSRPRDVMRGVISRSDLTHEPQGHPETLHDHARAQFFQ